jgi:hypothetical protein
MDIVPEVPVKKPGQQVLHMSLIRYLVALPLQQEAAQWSLMTAPEWA